MKAKREPRQRKVIKLRVVAVCCAVLLLLTALFWTSGPGIPSFDDVRESYRRSDAALLDRNLEVIHEIRVDPRVRRLEWAPLDTVSPAFLEAVVASEDRRFYEHAGVDWQAVAAAVVGALRGTSLRGASTITMQVAARLEEEAPRQTRRSVWQKILQMRGARRLETLWSKPEILEAYLNLVAYRGEIEGIAAASGALFGKKPHGLDHVESVILAALVRAPNAGAGAASRRACVLAESMRLPIGCEEVQSRAATALSSGYIIQRDAALASHVAVRLLGSGDGGRAGGQTSVVCSLDGRLQRFVVDILRHHLLAVERQNVRDGAVLVLDNRTGEVLAYAGNSGAESSARYVDGIQARRQAGSTLKPFLYGISFEKRLLTPASLLDDSPLEIPLPGGIYSPKNYDQVYHGLVTARTALGSSLNVPAVKVLNLAGVEDFVEALAAFGFRNLQAPEYYGPSLALGSADVTLWDLTNAYRALANGGVFSDAVFTLTKGEPPSGVHVLSPEAAYIVSDILSDRESRTRTFSLESPLSTRFWTAVKTGTSKDMRDNWCVGYSDRFTVGVWVGNFSGEPMWNVSGITGAAPVWVEVMERLHKERPSRPPSAPSGIVARNTEFPDLNQGRREWFIRGTEEGVIREASAHAPVRIVSPVPGTIVALDPDIPGEHQKLFFECEPRSPALRWRLNGREVGTAESLTLWTPEKGRHSLALVDRANRIVDSVEFEVRGNSVTSGAVGAPSPTHQR